ncbi:MAG: ion transporter [Spirochaetia bacterium]
MNFEKIRQGGNLQLFFLDLIMVTLLLVNLTWILFDWLFAADVVQSWLADITPRFTRFYADTIAPNFLLYDLGFIAVFMAEFMYRWIRAIARKSYHRWFFFPFVHWYDVLGLIPIAGFRLLRLLRIISITLRLHRSGIIDLTDLPAFRFLAKYYNVALQEITDRVTVNLIGEAQEEVRHGGPVVDRIIDEVVRPQKESLVEWLSHRVETVAAQNYERYRGDIRKYVRQRINHALAENREFKRLEHVPVFGSMMRDAVESAVSDMVFTVVRDIMQDIASKKNRAILNESVEIVFDTIVLKEEDSALSHIVVDTVDRSLEIVKQQISIQKWKLRDQAFDEEDFRRRMRAELHRLGDI